MVAAYVPSSLLLMFGRMDGKDREKPSIAYFWCKQSRVPLSIADILPSFFDNQFNDV
jgi:hypothetical protein